MDSVPKWTDLKASDSGMLIISAVVAFLGLLLFVLLQRRKSSRGNTILIVGPSDAGKTAIFSKLTYNSALPTHTSMQIDSSAITTSTSPLRSAKLVDVPGHPRIRGTFANHIEDAKAVIFVVDTSTIARNGPAVAEHLHLILNAISSFPPSKATPPVLIHAHKSDSLVVRSNTPSSSISTKSQTRQLAKERARTILERELEKRRKLAKSGVNVEGLSAVVGKAAEDADEVAGGGLECSTKDGTFKFDQWDGGDVSFSAGWVDIIRDDGITSTEASEGGEDGLSELKGWLETLP